MLTRERNMKSRSLFRAFWLALFCLTCALEAIDLPPSTEIEIPMRDGTKLKADLYLPMPGATKLPCLLIRTPAGRKNPYALMYLPLLKQGFALVIEETRSAQDPEGKTLPFLSDGWGPIQDGYDSIEWLSKQEISNGSVGTVGASAMGITQLLTAPTCPPSLKAQYIAFACSDFYHQGLYHHGELLKHQIEGWLGLYAKHPDVYKAIYTQPVYNQFWTQFNMLPQADRCDKPAMHVGGWYDTFLNGTLEAFQKLQLEGGPGSKGTQKLVVGPWCHLWPFVTSFGEYDYPKEALNPPYDFSPERWFAHYLKGENNGVENLPTVMYYVMGPLDGTPSLGNRWQTAESWPPESTPTPFYLSNDQLTSSLPATSSVRSYSYDPEKPIPTLGGRNLFLPSGPINQNPIENREDLLLFTSAPLENDLEITGNMRAVLFVDSDQEDTAFSVRLTDVYPDGKSLLIADSSARLSHLITDDHKPHEIQIDLWATSIVIAKGHRLRAIVSSSNYPRYEKHLNHKKRPHETDIAYPAKNTLFFGPEHPSRIILPIVKSANVKEEN